MENTYKYNCYNEIYGKLKTEYDMLNTKDLCKLVTAHKISSEISLNYSNDSLSKKSPFNYYSLFRLK